jgi:RNA polymerase sigma-70 factor (ECF subfamily)
VSFFEFLFFTFGFEIGVKLRSVVLLKSMKLSEAIHINLYYPVSPMNNHTAGNDLTADSSLLFEDVFKSHFKSLHVYAITIVKDETIAEEMVQNVFFKLWEKKEQIRLQQSVKAYLYRAVHNECLNHLKHDKVKAGYKAHAIYANNESESAADPAIIKELERHIDKALKELPEQCRTIFQLSRFEDQKYHMIASQLGISVKTVENQMGKALRMLRQKLMDFLPVIVLFLLNL